MPWMGASGYRARRRRPGAVAVAARGGGRPARMARCGGGSSAAKRLKRLGTRPQFISHERSVKATQDYLAEAYPKGNFTFVSLPFGQHTDTWVLRDIPPRKTLRHWFRKALNQPGGFAPSAASGTSARRD